MGWDEVESEVWLLVPVLVPEVPVLVGADVALDVVVGAVLLPGIDVCPLLDDEFGSVLGLEESVSDEHAAVVSNKTNSDE